jgi:hypothetical protein
MFVRIIRGLDADTLLVLRRMESFLELPFTGVFFAGLIKLSFLYQGFHLS